ncbi:zinc finger and BTB domain-containing protein 21 isoform X4 [Talpa occidentalis]|uniref:zinc finger and BTB domain-containing protein 21 isoform X4 n=1 Tax=Talpa occidentalis TaxID=50954 RepID=UPI00188EEEDD|nr:zinc finger and BTB domain-containing protein 21 isoform X4 [Talpa occidentalis]
MRAGHGAPSFVSSTFGAGVSALWRLGAPRDCLAVARGERAQGPGAGRALPSQLQRSPSPGWLSSVRSWVSAVTSRQLQRRIKAFADRPLQSPDHCGQPSTLGCHDSTEHRLEQLFCFLVRHLIDLMRQWGPCLVHPLFQGRQAMEGLLHYINPAHAISLLSALNEERLKGQLCDVLLIVGDQKFRAHKNVLAASSEYFQSLFTNKENEAQTVFQLDFCEPDAFDNVLNYIYSSSLFVEKGSLAAVQELGYSLGISFLTNIVSKTPQAPFPTCPSRRRAFLEDDDSSAQQRSVIVCQGRNDAQGKALSQLRPDPSPPPRPPASAAGKLGPSRTPAPPPAEPPLGAPLPDKSWPKESPGGLAKPLEQASSLDEPSRGGLVKRNAVVPAKPPQEREAVDDTSGAGGPLPKGKAIELALKRPRPPVLALRSASETPYLLKETGKGGGAGEDRNLLYYSKLGLVVPSGGSGPGSQSIDRSGPLVKSLLRRSLSMDSQVPIYSPSIDLSSPPAASSVAARDGPGRGLCAFSQKPASQDGGGKLAPDTRPPDAQPHRLRSFSASQSTEREATPSVAEVRVKMEPRSPLSDPADIIRVTVGDAASAAVTRDLSLKAEDDQKDVSRLPAKRRFQADRRLPAKRPKVDGLASPASEDHFQEGPSPPLLDADFPDSDLNKDEFEQGSHERLCRSAAVCPYCSLRFLSPELKREHETQCEHRKLTCLECMRTFKSSFSIWRHQVEVHNQNTMAPADSASLPAQDHNGDVAASSRPPAPPELPKANHVAAAKEDHAFSDSSEPMNFDSEDSSCLPEDLSLSKQLKVQVKEEPAEEAEEEAPEASAAPREAAGPRREPGLWPCEKCGKTFPAHKQLERHQELLCSVKPFICHVCNKAFRTNFRLWSHFQSHMAQAADDAGPKDSEGGPAPACSPSPPPLPPPPPLPKIQPLEPDSPTGPAEHPPAAPEQLFVPQESDTLFYHAPPLSAITFKRQFMCKLCHRTFKTAFSLWSHEQTHS